MKEIVERLHENRQIELAKEILESNGYEVKLKEDSNRKVISAYANQLADAGAPTLEDIRDDMITGLPSDKYISQVYDTIAKWLNTPENQIYYIDYEGGDSYESMEEIYNELADADHTRLEHIDIDQDGEYGYHAGVALHRLNSTGELFVSVGEYFGDDGEYHYFFCVAANK